MLVVGMVAFRFAFFKLVAVVDIVGPCGGHYKHGHCSHSFGHIHIRVCGGR